MDDHDPLDGERAILDLVVAFSPKVVPLDVTPEGTYEEATTRWRLNPIYEAIPLELRLAAEAEMHPFTRGQIQAMRAPAGHAMDAPGSECRL